MPGLTVYALASQRLLVAACLCAGGRGFEILGKKWCMVSFPAAKQGTAFKYSHERAL